MLIVKLDMQSHLPNSVFESLLNDGEFLSNDENILFVSKCLRNDNSISAYKRSIARKYFFDVERALLTMKFIPDVNLHLLMEYSNDLYRASRSLPVRSKNEPGMLKLILDNPMLCRYTN